MAIPKRDSPAISRNSIGSPNGSCRERFMEELRASGEGAIDREAHQTRRRGVERGQGRHEQEIRGAWLEYRTCDQVEEGVEEPLTREQVERKEDETVRGNEVSGARSGKTEGSQHHRTR